MSNREDFSLLVKGLVRDCAGETQDHYIFTFPSMLPLPAQQKRIDVIQQRIRSLALLLAFAFPAWSILDALAFPHDLWISSLEVRLVAGAAFASFLLLDVAFIRRWVHGLRLIYLQLLTVFAIPTILYLFCYKLPGALLEPTPLAKAIANSYHLLPFVVLSCVGLFPLTILESGTIAVALLVTYFIANVDSLVTLWTPDLGAAWIMALIGIIAVVVSHSQLRLLMSLVGYSSYDLLTDCLGRRSGEEVVKALWHYSVRRKSSFSVVFIDLDHFKHVNDRFGHKEGDVVLSSVAATIKKSLRKSDFVIRWGGEEFLIIMPDARLEDAARVMARMASAGFCAHPDGTLQTVSMGIAERINDNADNEDMLIKIADERLYKAKASGRCRAVGIETTVFPVPQAQKA